MKGILPFAAAMLILISRDALPQVPKEKMPEFIATGAVVTFDEVCLKIYTDYARANEWMKSHSSQENRTSSADAYREEKTDRVFLVGSDLASYVVAFGEANRCTVYSEPGEKETAVRLLDELMSGYAAQWKTKFEKIEDYEKGKEHVVSFEAKIPGTDKPILVIMVDYISMRGDENPLIKVSGISLRRLQTTESSRSAVPQ